MALQEYQRKRSFARTPEPPGTKPRKQVRVYTRSGLDGSGKLPHLVEAISNLGRDLRLDGELVALDARGYSDFNALQHALMAGNTGDGKNWRARARLTGSACAMRWSGSG